MLPDRVSNPGPLTYESGALPIALCGPSHQGIYQTRVQTEKTWIRLHFRSLGQKIPQ